MLDALEEWLGNGTRLMYLGGNGFYWVTSVDSKRPHVIEVRRRDFPGATAAPLAGEGIHSTTGEPGGTWAQRGRPPEGLTGVGTCAIGWQTAAPYRLTSERANDRAAFAFEGVSSTVVGEHGLHLGAAGGALGWLAGIGALAIPGLGPFIAAGPIMAALAGVAAACRCRPGGDGVFRDRERRCCVLGGVDLVRSVPVSRRLCQ